MILTCNIQEIKYRKTAILRDVTFSASSGKFLSVIGKNGTGKTTLISAVAGILPYRGTITLDGVDISALTPRDRAQRIALMPQLLRTPHITVEELVSFGRSPYLKLGQQPTETDRRLTEAAIRDADLESLRGAYLDRISGGELRRAYFGMILAQDTPVILLDEATAFLDADYEARFLFALKETAAERGKIVVSVMHHLDEAVRLSDDVLLIDEGTLRYFGSAAELLETELLETTFALSRYTCSSDGNERVFFAPKNSNRQDG